MALIYIKLFLSKPLSNQEMLKMFFHRVSKIQSRVESTAKLLGCKGSEAVRTKVADDLSSRLSQMIRDTFEDQQNSGAEPILSQIALHWFLKKLAPNVNLKVSAVRPGANYHGCVTSLMTDNGKSVKGYNLEIPFDNGNFIKKDDSGKLGTLCHEARHFFNFITEPKYQAKITLRKIPRHKALAGWNFYGKVLYNEEANALPGHDFATRLKKHLVEDKAARSCEVKKNLDSFLFNSGCSPNEKIQLLQQWRHELKTEIAAYKDKYMNTPSQRIAFADSMQKITKGEDVKFGYRNELGENVFIDTANEISLDDKINAVGIALIKKGQSAYFSTVYQQGFLPEKLKVVEKTLAEEIGKVRAKQKNLFGKPENPQGNSFSLIKSAFLNNILSFFKRPN
jgi:hypothetical protein